LDHFLIPAKDENLTIYLIGHPDRLPLKVDPGVGLWNPTEERMQLLATFCKNEEYEYGYAELDKTERLVVKCLFKHGASGCPGVVSRYKKMIQSSKRRWKRDDFTVGFQS
jgi:hypothetical protein